MRAATFALVRACVYGRARSRVAVTWTTPTSLPLMSRPYIQHSAVPSPSSVTWGWAKKGARLSDRGTTPRDEAHGASRACSTRGEEADLEDLVGLKLEVFGVAAVVGKERLVQHIVRVGVGVVDAALAADDRLKLLLELDAQVRALVILALDG